MSSTVMDCHALAPRELEVLTLAAEGNSRPEIAAKMTVTQNTVDGYFKNIYLKMGTHKVAHAVSLLLSHPPNRA